MTTPRRLKKVNARLGGASEICRSLSLLDSQEGIFMDTTQRLTELLNSHNTTLYTISKETGLHFCTLKKAVQRHSQLSVDTIERICDCLGIELYQFFMDDTDWELLQEYVKGRMKK